MQCVWGVLKHDAQMCADPQGRVVGLPLQLAFLPTTTPRNRKQLVLVRIQERLKERVGVFSVFCLLLRIKTKTAHFTRQTGKSRGYQTITCNNISKKDSTISILWDEVFAKATTPARLYTFILQAQSAIIPGWHLALELHFWVFVPAENKSFFLINWMLIKNY